MKLRKRRQYLNRINHPLGPRCRGYNAGSVVCQSYRYLDSAAKFPSFEEVCAITTVANRLISHIYDMQVPEQERQYLLKCVDGLSFTDLMAYPADDGPLTDRQIKAL